MPKWAENGNQVVVPPDPKIEEGFTRGQGVSVGHLNWALSQAWENFYDPYPDIFEVVAGDLTKTHSGTPLLPGIRFGYDSTSGGFDFFAVVTYTAGTADNPSGTLSTPVLYRTGVLGGDTIAVDADNVTANFGTNGLYLDGPTTAHNSENTLLLSRTSVTGGALSATHGFEAGSKRVNTADNAVDTRRYAYPSSDKLAIAYNLCPTMGGWRHLRDVGGSSAVGRLTVGSTLVEVDSDGYYQIGIGTTTLSTNIGGARCPLTQLLHNKDVEDGGGAHDIIYTLTKLTAQVDNSHADITNVGVEIIEVPKVAASANPTRVVKASASTTPTGKQDITTSTLSVALNPIDNYYFVQVFASCAANSNNKSFLVRNVVVHIEKSAVE